MNVECPKCGTKKVVKITEELRGKRIGFTCKTAGCGEKVMVQIPKSEVDSKERKTIILGATPSRQFAELKVLNDNDETTAKHLLREGINLIGRASTSSKADIAIVTEDKYMSRSHCTITAIHLKSGSAFLLKDYQSRNETYVNGQLLNKKEEIYLQNYDILQLGKTKLKIEIRQ